MKKLKDNSGIKLYDRAKGIIPGGNQLLSKRPEMFLPGLWPSYYKKAKGIDVWDMDNNKYQDFSILGIGTCSLGYANKYINRAVKKAISNGSMCTLNSYEEVLLTEKLLELHPFAEMVRYTRSGGEALAVAVRIARAASGKNRITLCGYHGWHDWYLATNISKSNGLDNLLLPGLVPNGVPEVLKDTSIPFHHGNIDELEKIIRNHDDIGVIVMEVQRNREPDLDFIRGVREIASKIGAVLIFDEVSSGFRLNIGGVHQLYGIDPDICVLGKALGNGHPISAVLGRKDVMQYAQSTFISSSYWTERVGFVAGLTTIREFEKQNVIEYLMMLGNFFENNYSKIFNDLNLNISTVGMLTVPTLAIKEDNPLILKTIYTREMLKRGYLASNLTYLCSSHSIKKAKKFFENCFEVFKEISSGQIREKFDGEVCHSGFQRLT